MKIKIAFENDKKFIEMKPESEAEKRVLACFSYVGSVRSCTEYDCGSLNIAELRKVTLELTDKLLEEEKIK